MSIDILTEVHFVETLQRLRSIRGVLVHSFYRVRDRAIEEVWDYISLLVMRKC